MIDIQVGDRVRVTIEGNVSWVATSGYLGIDGWHRIHPHEGDVTVEHIEPEYAELTVVRDAGGRDYIKRPSWFTQEPWRGLAGGNCYPDSHLERPLTIRALPVEDDDA